MKQFFYLIAAVAIVAIVVGFGTRGGDQTANVADTQEEMEATEEVMESEGASIQAFDDEGNPIELNIEIVSPGDDAAAADEMTEEDDMMEEDETGHSTE